MTRRILVAIILGACSGPSPMAGHDVSVTDARNVADASPDAAAEVDAATCTPNATDEPPRSASYETTIAGQTVWIHDDGLVSGYFHTYDALAIGAADESPHKIHVYLPFSYPSSCTRYPVVYFNDGNTTFWPGGLADESWNVGAALAQLYAAHALPEVIVVAIEPIDRNREYTNVAWQSGTTCCGLPGYVSWLGDSLKPFIDSTYRTKADPGNTLVVGSSHGGLASFYTAATRPEVFGNAISMSSSFWVGLDDTSGVVPVIGGPLAGSPLVTQTQPTILTGHPRLYMDWGLVRTGGAYNSSIEACATNRSRELAGLLESDDGYTLGKDLFTVEDPDGQHDEISWGSRIANALTLVWGNH